MKVPSNLLYTKDHEWLLSDKDGTALIGITDYAQNSLGDVTFVELPNVGQTLSTGEGFGVVESVKAASDLYMPIAGEVVEVNETLADQPELVNQSPYEGAWMLRIKIADPEQVKSLMSPEEYEEHTR